MLTFRREIVLPTDHDHRLTGIPGVADGAEGTEPARETECDC